MIERAASRAVGLPQVSAVFVSFNRKDSLREALRRMTAESGYPADRLEVIVVDNASEDGAPAMVREEYPEVRLIALDHNGGAPSWNEGFRVAKGEYVLILDDDAYLLPGDLEKAVGAARDVEADLVSFTVVSSLDERSVFNEGYGTGLLSFWGCAALVSRRALDALGGYDPNMFIWANELEFTMRLLDEGFRHLFLPEVRAVHMKEPSPGYRRHRNRVNNRHFAYVAGKLMQPRHALATVGGRVMHTVVDAVAEEPMAIRALPGVFAGFAEGLRNRRPVRPVVSATYWQNFPSLNAPWRFMRTPKDRWRARVGKESVDAQRREQWGRYFEERRRFYPEERATLEL
jgi:GT2 family glycosyltransferase